MYAARFQIHIPAYALSVAGDSLSLKAHHLLQTLIGGSGA